MLVEGATVEVHVAYREPERRAVLWCDYGTATVGTRRPDGAVTAPDLERCDPSTIEPSSLVARYVDPVGDNRQGPV
jgi:hypothetical protein